jgi:hypothetical protein
MVKQALALSLQDVVLIDDSFMDIRDAALFGPDYVFIHNLQTRRQRFPRDLRISELPQWFEPKRMLIPHETRVSCLDAAGGPEWDREFLPVYAAPESALLNARRILVSAPAVMDLEARLGVHFAGSIPSDLDRAFEVGQSRFHVLQDFYIACAETTADPIGTLRALVAKTEGYHVRRVWGSGDSRDQERLDLPPLVVIDHERLLIELIARRLEERFFWNWKLHAIVASRRGTSNPEWPESASSSRRWEDELANPFAVQMLYRIRGRQAEGFPVSDVRPWSGTGRYPNRDLPQHWRGSLAGLRRAVDNKERLNRRAKQGKRRSRETMSDLLWTFPDGSDFGLGAIPFERFGLSDDACAFLNGLHPDCNDIDLPLRLLEWLTRPDEAAEAAMAMYLRTWFGKLLRYQKSVRDAAPMISSS